MRRAPLIWSLSILALAACGASHADTSTLPPLDSERRDGSVVTVPEPLGTVPHQTWYLLHYETIDEQLREMRRLAATLEDTDDPGWLALICTTGIDLDRPAQLAAYDAPGAHPEWVSAIDLTRWMIAGCASDARRSVEGVLPLLSVTLTRFEGWLATTTKMPSEPNGSEPSTTPAHDSSVDAG